jgi:predicted RNA-binding Zn ribbon-like protein
MSWLWIDFVNSLAHDPLGRCGCEDRLERAGWLDAFLKRQGLGRIAPGERPRAIGALRDLRCLIRRCTTRLVEGQPIRPADVAALNRHLQSQPLIARLRKQACDEKHPLCLELVPTEPGIGAIIAAIARSFARFICEEDPTRLKLCENPDCCWVFHDTTRSRTKRWCADSCGNLMKVRRFREKKRN